MNDGARPHRVIRASAGSGKTHQLTNRYLQLLVTGTAPDAILATTFTRKAAGEILDRVLHRLANAAGDVSAAAELAKQIGAPQADPAQFITLLRQMVRDLHRARISTLDSFYISLAGSFSFELGMPAGWAICEAQDDELLRREALEQLLDLQPDDIGRLLPLLSKGETKRSITRELQSAIGSHYDIFLSSPPPAWQTLKLSEPVSESNRTAAFEQLRSLSITDFPEKRFLTARDKDLANFHSENWLDFVEGGLAKKVIGGETNYYNKPIPPAALANYKTLIQHACGEILRMLAQQTKATWGLLHRFHAALWAAKQTTGQWRFQEVTQALVMGMEGRALRPSEIAFRLDATIDHLLLDEFQDTSLPQWHVLEPLAKIITKETDESDRSFFCVGDAKQAIYGWRGGMTQIFSNLKNCLGQLSETTLAESRRSAQPIIDVVNKVFSNLDAFEIDEKYGGALTAWSDRFEPHTTAKQDALGYVCLRSGPEQDVNKTLAENRNCHYAYAADLIRDIAANKPTFSIGVLCRTNPVVGRLMYELRKRQVRASEEGGNPLDDSPAVELLLSLFTLADHPGHSVALFHLRNSPADIPLIQKLASAADADTLSRQLRSELLTKGYGLCAHDWAKLIAPICNEADLSRLQQLVELAYAYQDRSTLRADDFVAWVRNKRVPDPSAAAVRVMTIHAAKGLEFDAVILPELDVRLVGMTPAFVVGRDANNLAANFVCRYAPESVQKLLDDTEQVAFDQDRQQRVEESLSLLYVAMTRAVHALYMVVPGPREKKFTGNLLWSSLLLQLLAPQAAPAGREVLFEHGDVDWRRRRRSEPIEAEEAQPPAPESSHSPIAFHADPAARRRVIEHVAPSRREGKAQVQLDRLFQPSEGTGMAAGTLYHAWFESISWLDDGPPTEAVLRAVAQKHRHSLPPETWHDLDRLLGNFTTWLAHPAIRGVLCRSAYAKADQPSFPASLKTLWRPSFVPLRVEQERRFLVPDSGKFWNGSLDRIVWLADGEQTVAADVLDFKTDLVNPGDEQGLAARIDHYRPQLDAYRNIVAKMAGLAPENVSARLVFTIAGRVVDV